MQAWFQFIFLYSNGSLEEEGTTYSTEVSISSLGQWKIVESYNLKTVSLNPTTFIITFNVRQKDLSVFVPVVITLWSLRCYKQIDLDYLISQDPAPDDNIFRANKN